VPILPDMERMKTTTSTPYAADAAERKVSMTSTITASHEAEVREFAREFPTLQVRRMVALCEAGRISWAEAHEISRRALAAGLEAVK
jgi:hypothetical protein